MAVLVLLVGLPGAGKTFWSRRLEEERDALRLTPDEWMQALFNTNEVDGRRWVLESEMFWGVAARMLVLGVDVILDYGCWSMEERDLFRTRAHELGATTEIILLNPPFDVLWERIDKRNANLPPGTFRITRDELLEYQTKFEVPTAEELGRWDRQRVVTD
ncbi:AAA family ATPase [Kribbella sp. NPDC004875]|uniref:AAA family ATPase n=1 Tax=Kribbella sp. NPDC004875 TaxID=3364107 RepID=UPI00368A254E